MYYLKLATGPTITLSAQALDTTNANTSSTGSITTTTTTTSSSSSSASTSTTSALDATATTSTTVFRPTATLYLKTAPGLNNANKNATGISGLKPIAPSSVVKTSVTIAQQAKTSSKRNQSSTSPSISNTDSSVIKLALSPSPSGSNGNNSVASQANVITNNGGGGGAAAARLLDLGKRLLEAAREGQTELVRQLTVDSGAPFTSDWLGTTALHMAAQNGFVEIAEILINGGVNRDAKTKLDRTALHLAAQSGSVEIVDLLISNGADLNARDMLKMTPLHWAVERGHTNVVERLLIAGSDFTIKNKFQLTPVDIGRNSGNYGVIKLFNNWTGIGGGNGICSAPPSGSNTSHLFNDHAQQHHFQTPTTSGFNFNQDLEQFLGGLGAGGFSSDSSPLMTQVMNAANKTNLYRNQQQQQPHSNLMMISSISVDESQSNFFPDIDQSLAMLDSAGSLMNSSRNNNDNTTGNSELPSSSATPISAGNSSSPEEDCFDLVELEWNNIDFSEFFTTSSSGGDEPNVEYLMKVVEELQKENKQLRQQVEQLSTTSTT